MFVICRALHAEVGDREALKTLQPTSEYQPLPRSFTLINNDPSLDTIGQPWEDPFRVRWTGSLPEFKIPANLLAVLQGSPKGLIGAVQKAFMPKSLTLETYAQYWQVLLHIEEAQQTSACSLVSSDHSLISWPIRIDLKKYSMEDVRLNKEGKLY